jgi:hypothetical protein
MLGHDDTQLVALCRRCHELVEFDDMGNRRSRDGKRKFLLNGRREQDQRTE